MPVKMTKPRKGAKPMAYFKGTPKGVARLKPKTVLAALSKGGAEFYGEAHAHEEARRFVEDVAQISKNLEKGKAALTTIGTKGGVIPVRIVKTRNGRVLIHQQPQTHGVSHWNFDPYRSLEAILSESFLGTTSPNTLMEKKRIRHGYAATQGESPPKITNHDLYSIEVMAPIREVSKNWQMESSIRPNTIQKGMYFIKKARPEHVVSVNITLDSGASPEIIKQKMAFYKKQLQERFGVPVKFIKN